MATIAPPKYIHKLIDQIKDLLELGRQTEFRMADEQTHNENYVRQNLYIALGENPKLEEWERNFFKAVANSLMHEKMYAIEYLNPPF